MPHLPVYSTEVGGPVVHQTAPTLEEITARIRCLGGVAYRMGERGFDLWVANYYSARNPLRLSSLVILGVVARMFRCATRSSCWCT